MRAAGIFCAFALALAPVGAEAQVSPGALSRAHASLDTLESCTSCHSGAEAVDTGRCLGCHGSLAKRISAGRGFHARVRGRSCESCHVEHRGRGASITRWPSGRMETFDHAALAGFVLEGEHARARCRDCHQSKNVRGGLAGASPGRTFLGLSTACSSCHADPHRPSLGSSCQTCHTAASWSGAASGFDHSRARFPLRGAHARVRCNQCHAGATEGSPATFRGIAFATCESCHDDPHAGRLGDDASCSTCHVEQSWQTTRFDRARHAPRTFPLSGAHGDASCNSCHGARLAGNPQTACVSCHRDAHQPSLGTACQTCHSTAAWSGRGAPARRPATFHDRTAFPLEGAHQSVDCAKCHDPRVPASRRFRPIDHDACADCHDDPHQGELASRPDGGKCDACHDAGAFAPARFEAADHARTRFPLEGAHLATACRGCHERPPASPGFRREDRMCESCHEDRHAGQFGSRTCAECHDTRAFAPSRFGPAEHLPTGFALTGAHDARCVRCHASSEPTVPARFVDRDSDCGSCHRDPHSSQFSQRECTSCHAGDQFAPAPRFDHARTRFPLEAPHRSVACAGCHQPVNAPGAPGTVVYRLGAASCGECHDSPHGSGDADDGSSERRLADATAGCDGCHRGNDWSGFADVLPASFDHSITGSPLVGAHENVACASCHVSGRETPSMSSCASCHEDRHRGARPEPCTTCHSTRSWSPDGAHDAHRRTRFPLVGAHAVQTCDRCHERVADGDFRGASAQCRSCHLDTVRERNPDPPHVGATFLRSCERCHDPLAWRPAGFDHSQTWPLTGAHRSASCQGCHPGGRFEGTPRECVGCHDGEQARSRVDHGVFSNVRNCDLCHDTSAWRPADFGDHNVFFPISGAHSGMTCNQCHQDPDTFASFTCIDCHAHSQAEMADKHREVSGYRWESTSCLRCHPRGTADD